MCRHALTALSCCGVRRMSLLLEAVLTTHKRLLVEDSLHLHCALDTDVWVAYTGA